MEFDTLPASHCKHCQWGMHKGKSLCGTTRSVKDISQIAQDHCKPCGMRTFQLQVLTLGKMDNLLNYN